MVVAFQPNMQSHDELSALFSRNLTFNPELLAQAQAQAPPPEPQNNAASEPTSSQPINYSISQHYHHSAHTVKPSAQLEPGIPEEPRRPSSEPPQSDNLTSESILSNHGIDPATLTPSQLQLFRIADPSQQLRLMELWSICPPTRGGDIPALAWSSTTLEQEEHLARLRYERLQNDQTMSLDGTSVQNTDGVWSRVDTEPYMAAGYDDHLRREDERRLEDIRPRDVYSHFGTAVGGGPAYTSATDPVYMGPDFVRQQQQMDMATQYGAFEQFRGVGEVDAMDVM